MARVRLITDSILAEFANLVYANRQRLVRVWLLSPWVAGDDHKSDALYLLLESLRKSSCSLVLFTRPPKEVWHHQAIEMLEREARAMVFLAQTLHSKLYIVECDGFKAALVGSANFTRSGNIRNREIAIELKASREQDEISKLIDDLILYASELRSEEDVKAK